MDLWLLEAFENGVGPAGAKGKKRDATDDPRVGSARDNGTATTILRVPAGSNSASGYSLLMTLIPVFIFAVICIAVFLFLRTRYPRIYSPRTILRSLPPQERSEPLPTGWFNWILPFWRIPDRYVLDHCSLDAFLFLRYIKIVCVICIVGCILTWPVLFPLHIMGGNGNIELDLFNFGNVHSTTRYYAHAVLAWIYFAFILYMVSRECIYYIHLRQAYLLSPMYAERLSSRTVLFTCVPRQDLDERKLQKLFGDSVRSVWIPRNTEDLERAVKEKEETTNRLQRAEVALITKVDAARKRMLKVSKSDRGDKGGKGEPDLETGFHTPTSEKKQPAFTTVAQPTSSTVSSEDQILPAIQSPPHTSNPPILYNQIDTEFSRVPPPDINGSVAAQWIGHEERPTHRPLANYLRKVDTIKWCRIRIKDLNIKTEKMKKILRSGKGEPIPAAFIEFDSQVNAQSAYQTLCHHRAFHMTAETVGVHPNEIVWKSLRMKWWERIVRKFSVQGFVAVMVIFWSLPCALVGTISNITHLANSISFLHWILGLPKPVLGLITGLLPAVALSFLMSLVPGIMRMCARMAGTPTLSQIELFTQNAYFGFQVVQVFLVTTLTSAASAAITDVIQNPPTIKDVLSQNIPKASNFYVSYFILQGLALSASGLVHFFSLIRDQWCLYSSGNPRVIVRRWFRLRRLHWGAVYPVFTNMGVIAITYSIIAPLILGFAVIGLFPIYLVYKYNLLYVFGSPTNSHTTHAFEPIQEPSSWRTRTFISPDAQGLHYPRALKQTLMGLYLAEICLFGLFTLQFAFGPLIMMVALIVFTGLVHVSLNAALGPLMHNLPRTLALAEAARRRGEDISKPMAIVRPLGDFEFGDNPAYFDVDGESVNSVKPDASAGFGDNPAYYEEQDLQDQHGESYPKPPEPEDGSRAMEGLPTATNILTTSVHGLIGKHLRQQKEIIAPYIEKVNFWTPLVNPVREEGKKPNFVLKWLHPEIFEDYEILRRGVPEYEHPQDFEFSPHEEEFSRQPATDQSPPNIPISPTVPTSPTSPTSSSFRSPPPLRHKPKALNLSLSHTSEDPPIQDVLASPTKPHQQPPANIKKQRKVKILYPSQTFEPPCMVSSNPKIWIPKDEAEVWKQEVRHCKVVGGLDVGEEGVWFEEGGGVGVDFDVVFERAVGIPPS